MSHSAKQFLKEVVTQVTRSVQNIDINRVEVAKDLYWANNVIVWRLTDYRSFSRFVESELKMPVTTAYVYRLAGRKISDFKYSDAECHRIIRAIGWVRFCNGMNKQMRRLSAATFIAKYRNLPFNHASNKRDPDGDIYFSVSVPNAEGCKFTAKLMEYGMSESHGRRHGVRDAMISFINEEL